MNDLVELPEKGNAIAVDGAFLRCWNQFVRFSLQFIVKDVADGIDAVYGKKSLLNRHPGNLPLKFAGLRALYGYMMAHPGKKLLFMGGEFGQFDEWDYNHQLNWHLCQSTQHAALQHCVKTLNALYRQLPALYEDDDSWNGFQWIEADDCLNSILCFLRTDRTGRSLLCVVNFTPLMHKRYTIGLPQEGMLKEIFSTDDPAFGGKGYRNKSPIPVRSVPHHGFPCQADICIPPLGCIYLAYDRSAGNGGTGSGIYSGKEGTDVFASS